MLLFLIPLLVILLMIYLMPLINTFVYSFMDTMGPVKFFNGIENFKKVSGYIWPVIGRTLIWTFGSIIPAMIIGLIAATIFQGKYHGKKFLVTLCLLPYTMPLIIVATTWYFTYQPNFGLLNVLLESLGLTSEPIMFLNYERAMASVIVARIWRAMPFAFVVYYAAIQNIPNDILESSEIDGCSKAKQFFYVVLPQLKSATLTSGIILTVTTFMVFDIIFTLTRGGPVDATTILPTKIYSEIFSFYDMGSTSVLSLISIVILTAISLVYWKALDGGGDLIETK